MGTLLQNLGYATRVLRKNPGFTVVAMLSLALGIGSTTAIFSVVYGVLISPYPYARPAEIWAPEIRNVKNPQQSRDFHHLSEYLEMQKVPAFASVMCTSPGGMLLSGNRAPERFQSVLVSANAFQFLGVAPVIGRTIQPSDVPASGEPNAVIVLSYNAWQRLFDGSADALGQKLVLDDVSYTVIGVMPPRFGWYTNQGGWLPLPIDLHHDVGVAAIVRLRPGVSKAAAEQQLQALHVSLAAQHPENFPATGFDTVLHNYLDVTVAAGEMQSSLRLLFGAVGFLLLIACANVANLQLARATSRAREIAVRMSVGAGRGHVIRQLLTESVVLSLAGGALGILFAIVFTKGVVALMPEFYVPNEARITVNSYVLGFSAGISVLTGILFGLAPALQCSRQDLVESLKDAARMSGASTSGGRTRSLLVVGEVALSVILLVGASLTIRGFVNLQHMDVGFQPDRVLMVGLQLPPKRYTTYQQRIAFSQSVLDRLRVLPGVQSAAIGNGGMPFGGIQSRYSLDGVPPVADPNIMVSLVSAGYAQTLGIRLLLGRGITDQEVTHADGVAMINEAAAKLWPAGTNPIGSRMKLDFLAKPRGSALPAPGATGYVTVVGILGNTRNAGLRDAPAPAVYVPYTAVAPPGRLLAVRTQGDPMQLLNAVRQQVFAVDKEQPLGRPITLQDVLGEETVQPRFNMALFSFFGLLGLALAAVGIYSVLSYSVARRTHEIGIRMALGAQKRDVLGLMLAMGARLAFTGLGVGLVGSYILARLLRSEVFQVPVTDPLTLAGVVGILVASALLACFVPAKRAASLDPMSALRHD